MRTGAGARKQSTTARPTEESVHRSIRASKFVPRHRSDFVAARFASCSEDVFQLAIKSFFRTFRFNSIQPGLTQLLPESLIPIQLDAFLRKRRRVLANEEFNIVVPPQLCGDQLRRYYRQTPRGRFVNLVRNSSSVPGWRDKDAR